MCQDIICYIYSAIYSKYIYQYRLKVMQIISLKLKLWQGKLGNVVDLDLPRDAIIFLAHE